MSTKTAFTMKLESELRDRFMAEAAAADRPAAQVVRELMRKYIDDRQQARESTIFRPIANVPAASRGVIDLKYNEFVRRKVERARASMRVGRGIPHDEVEAEAAERRAELLCRADETDL